MYNKKTNRPSIILKLRQRTAQLEELEKIKGSVALLELGGSHDECLFTQLVALHKDERDVILITDQVVHDRNPYFEPFLDEVKILNPAVLKKRRVGELRRLIKFLEKRGVTHLVLNTAQGEVIRDLCLLGLFTSIEFIGIVHTTRKFKGSFTQRIINRKVKKYLLLSEYLLSTITPPKGTKVDYFYPITFPSLTKRAHKGVNITIIGGVEKRRKDLEGFCVLLQRVSGDVQFTFLGKSNSDDEEVHWLKEQISLLGKDQQVKMYDSFVHQDEFYNVLVETDLILPLVHPDTPSADQYFRNQISGAMSVSFGHKIPMLIHQHYSYINEMKAAAFYYDLTTDFATITRENIEQKVGVMLEIKEYDSNFQERKYLEFIFDR